MTARRDFLAFTAGAVAAKTVLPMAVRAGTPAAQLPTGGKLNPDAELIATCAAFDKLERRVRALHECLDTPEKEDAVQPAIDAAKDQQAPLLDRICELRATTLEGMAARATSLALWAPDLVEDETPYTDARLVAAILRDAVTIAGEASP